MVKLTGSALAHALRDWPARFRGALIFGPDEGLVRERADALTRQIVPEAEDGLRVLRLDEERVKSDPAVLADELQALAMFGGRRLVRLKLAGDALAGTVLAALEAPAGDNFLLVTAGNLGPRSTLRRHFESAADLAAIACYADDERDLAALVDEWLRAHDITAEPEARAHLLTRLGQDRAATRAELEKLALYFGDAKDRRLDLARAEALVGGAGATGAQEIIRAAFAGDPAALERRLSSALTGGVEPIAILRILAQEVLRLWPLALACAGGMRPADVVGRCRPPIFFRDRPAVTAALSRLAPEDWAALLDALVGCEIAIKSGRPAAPLLRMLLIRLAGRGARTAAAARPPR